MSTTETNTDNIKNFMGALEANDRDLVANALADTFVFSGWTPRPLDKNGFLNVMAGIKEGIPGLIFNLHNVLEPDIHTVTAAMQVAGYQTDSFILPELGTPPIPQMASSVSLPAENIRFTLEQGLIQTWTVEHVAGGGVHGLIRQLGVDLILE